MVAKTGGIQRRVLTPARKSARHLRNVLTPRELRTFREMLLGKRRELLGDIDGMEAEIDRAEANGTTRDTFDDGIDAEDRFGVETTYGFIQAEASLLREIEEALQRIEEGTYGVCMGTGQPISKRRLLACPWAKYCIEYARALEKGTRPFPSFEGPQTEVSECTAELDADGLLGELVDLDEQMEPREARGIRRRFPEIDGG